MVNSTSTFVNDYIEVQKFMHSFFKYYYTERDPLKVATLISDNIIAIGLSHDEEAYNRDHFIKFMTKQMVDIPFSLPFTIVKYVQKAITDDSWSVLAKINIKIHTEEWSKVNYYMRLSVTLHKVDDHYLIDVIHASEAALEKRDNYEYNGESLDVALAKIISQLIPGGIVSCYLDDNYALKIANEHFLRLLEFEDYDEYVKEIDGHYINGIHPSDINKYIYNVNFALSTGKQCECEYRLRKKNGEYVWVHDVVRNVMTKDGHQIIFSALVDISEQIEKREKLEIETGIDVLTGVYNRKGAFKNINEQTLLDSNWAFFLADLDNFKLVNDIYGHKMGDKVLCYIANQFNAYFGHIGTVCRLGGDEFILFVSNFNDLTAICSQLEEVINHYNNYIKETCAKANSSLSVGGVFGYGLEDIEKIYDLADHNLYKIKKGSKGKVTISKFNDALN